MSRVSVSILEECKKKLLQSKETLLNNLNPPPDYTSEPAGDSADQTNRILSENEWFFMQSRLRQQLFEIEAALSRIESGSFGLCEETGNPIETKRLLALPWTRLSVEGAMARENTAH